MKKNKKLLNLIIILLSAIIVVLLFYLLFYQKNEEETIFNILDSDIKLKIGETKTINYSLNKEDLIVEWSSSNDNIIVNNKGEISAIDYGTSVITGIINDKDKVLTSIVTVTAYSGDIGVKIDNVDLIYGYILMKPNSEFEIPFKIVPENAYITSVKYATRDSNIAVISDNKIISKNPGETSIRAWFNEGYYIEMGIKVDKNALVNQVVPEIEKISFKDITIPLTMEMGDVKTLEYDVYPKDGYVYDSRWESSNENVVSVTRGVVEAKNIGTATISLTVNGDVKTEVTIKVISTKSEIIIDYNPKTTIRIGEKTNIEAHINPVNVNDQITYKSSNPDVVKVDKGVITGVKSGNAIITLSISNGKTKTFTINVLPKTGSLTGTGYLWGYTSLNAVTPVLASASFFQDLAKKGIGVLKNDTYIISKGDTNYSYDITSNVLTANSKRFKLRIYYPQGKDLSTLNTLTYMGGDGEKNFDGYFDNINSDPSKIKSAGIVILVAEGDNTAFDQFCGAFATQFVKAITNQKSYVKNSILGFSTGGTKVMAAANMFEYDKVIVFSSYYNWPTSADYVKNKEVLFYIPSNDHLYNQAKTTLNSMSDYQNVTVVSNSNEMGKLFGNKYLVINPGNLMKPSHLSVNVELSGIIPYAND